MKMGQGRVEYINKNKIGNIYHMFMNRYVQQVLNRAFGQRRTREQHGLCRVVQKTDMTNTESENHISKEWKNIIDNFFAYYFLNSVDKVTTHYLLRKTFHIESFIYKIIYSLLFTIPSTPLLTKIRTYLYIYMHVVWP